MKPILALAALALLAGCDSAGGGETRVPGELVRNEFDFPALAVPDTVVVGQQFTATTFTIGGGCYRIGDTEATVGNVSAEVRPFDLFLDPGPNGACTADLAYFPHTATFAFRQPGTATVRVVGTAGRSGFGVPTAETPRVTIEKTVVVVARGTP